MSKPTIEQLCEFFRQIDVDLITADSVQEVIERGWELALSQIKQRMTNYAWIVAKRMDTPELKVIALVELTLASQNTQALGEIRDLLSNFSIPNLDLSGIVKLTKDPNDALWAYGQYLRIVFPQRRAERLVELAVAFPGESDNYLIKARESISEIGDKYDRNKVRSDIAGLLARLGRFELARKTANESDSPYWRARSFVKIFRFSEKEEDRGEVEKYISFADNEQICKELAIACSELWEFGKAWEMVAKIEGREYIPDALVAIIKAAVETGDEISISKAMHMLLDDEYRWWRTQGHLLIATGAKGKVDKEYLEKIRRSILLCQDTEHRAWAYASLATISRNPSDLEAGYKKARDILDLFERIMALSAMLKAFK